MSKPLILTPAQAKAAYDAMCALNNVGGRIRATIPADTPHGQIEVRENAVGEVFVEGFGCEIYADQAEFATAYGLNAEIKRLSAHQDALVCALELMLERCPEPPDPNCSCFISPPCNDCVEHAGEREAFEFARAQLAKLGAAS